MATMSRLGTFLSCVFASAHVMLRRSLLRLSAFAPWLAGPLRVSSAAAPAVLINFKDS